jgi:nitrogen fixation protein
MIPNQVYDISKIDLQEPIIYILDKFDLTTNATEIEKVKRLWNKGTNIHKIADKIRPTQRGTTETFLLLLHMLEEGIIKPRKGGIWGGKQ